MTIPAYIKHTLFTVLFIIAAVNFTRTTLSIIDSSKRFDELKSKVSTLDDEKKALENDLEYKKTDAFVEKEARNKLGMAKPGEEIFVVGNILGDKSLALQTSNTPSSLQLWVQVFSRGFDNIDTL